MPEHDAARTHARIGLATALALGVACRLPWLGAVPSPAGDEGNWAWFGYNLSVGWPVVMAPEARFVPLTYAYLIAGSYKLFGPSFAAARAVPTAGVLAGLIAAWALARRLGMPRAAVAMALALALHPWSVAWSRTVTVPYALSLALAVVGPLAFLDALRTRSPWRMLLAAQLLGGALHFSPLAAIPIVACALHSFASERPRGWNLLAALTCALHVVPMALAAHGAVVVYNGRPRYYFTQFPLRLYVFLRAYLGSVDGEATLRHFTATEAPLALELTLAAVVVAFFAVSLRHSATNPALPLARYTRIHAVVALLGLPLMLAAGRPWNLPAIDAERYGFVAVAPFVLALGALAEQALPTRRLAAAALVAFCALPTARWGWFFARGGSPDRGFYTLAGGGGYRGWKVPREHEALAVLVRREVDRLRGDAPATLVMADYAFHPFHFVNADHGSFVVDIMKSSLPARPGQLHAFVLWSEGLIARDYFPHSDVEGNDRLRALMHAGSFTALRRVRVFKQPDGSPLCELWAAMRRQ